MDRTRLGALDLVEPAIGPNRGNLGVLYSDLPRQHIYPPRYHPCHVHREDWYSVHGKLNNIPTRLPACL